MQRRDVVFDFTLAILAAALFLAAGIADSAALEGDTRGAEQTQFVGMTTPTSD